MGKRKGPANRVAGGAQVNPLALQQAFNQAVALYQQGLFQEADTICRRLLKQVPGAPDLLNFRGLIACQSGELKRGIKFFREAVAATPDNPEYRVNLGNACKEIGRSDEAIKQFQAALKIKPDIPELHNGLGILYREKKDSDTAEKEFLEALRLRPSFAQAYFNLGQLYVEQGQKGNAVNCYKEAVRNKLDYGDAYAALANIYKDMNIAEKALPLYKEALKYKPKDYRLLNGYGAVLEDVGRTQEALDVSKKAFELAPKEDVYICSTLGERLQRAGNYLEAQKYFRQVLDQNPNAVGVYHSIAVSRKFQESDDEIAEMKRALERPGLDENALISLHFALGKVYNDCGRYDEAFQHYLEGNGLKRKSIEYSHEQTEHFFSELIDFFDTSFFAERTFPGSDSELPIFILGMPRSGTTLTEQIISSYSEVFGAGELGDVGRIANHLTSLAGQDAMFPTALLGLEADVLKVVTQRFLENLANYDPKARHIVDKMPHNFVRLGLIGYLLPNARIIHCRRNPLDNCISIFFQDFVGEHGYKLDLKELGLYYRQYERLMEHWKRVVPNPIFELQYEEMIADQEEVSRRLVEFCGLEWDDSCLEFYKTERSVKTASQWQVRQPVYSSSTERWRRYQKHIGPLIEVLGLSVEEN